jgi:predicted transcriptional regulator
MSRFKNVHPLMIYLPLKDRAAVKIYARKERIPVSQLVREGLAMRMTTGDRYTAGFNEAIKAAKEVTQNSKGGQMKFPSGKSFADIVCDDLDNLIRKEEDEPARVSVESTQDSEEDRQGD